MTRKYALLAVVALVPIACSDVSVLAGPEVPSLSVSLSGAGAKGETVPGQYVIVFKDDVQDVPGLAQRLVSAHGGSLRHLYANSIKGFSANIPDAGAKAIANNRNVAYVEQDQIVRVGTTQTNAPWGLDRIDQRALPLNGAFVYTPTGLGVRVYIVDTGIRLDHSEFTGRVSNGYDVIDGGLAEDCHGHGTHVAGTVGGTTYGVAKGASLVAVRVLDCDGRGTVSGVIAGIDWITANHTKPAVVNMSLGGAASTAGDDAVRRSIAAGVTYVVAAGNANSDACNYSPARVAEAVTVGATTSSDARSSFSNYGSCLDLFAPGSSIISAWHTSSTATNTISGTSMATPHAAGVAALYLQVSPGAMPASVASALVSTATTGRVTGAGTGSPDRLLFSLLTRADWVPIAPVESGDWEIGGVADMTGDGKADVVWQNRVTLQTGVWVMDGTTYVRWIPIAPVESSDWQIGGVADMTGDARPDIVWHNRRTLRTGVWVMNGTTYAGWVPMVAFESGDWEIGGVADMTGDGKADVVWQNRVTLQTGVWVMDGTTYVRWIPIAPVESSDWQIGGVADMTGNGKADVVWQNRVTRQAGVWMMDRTTLTGWFELLPIESGDWEIGGAVDMTGDGDSDIVCQNRVTLETSAWIRVGMTASTAVLPQSWGASGRRVR